MTCTDPDGFPCDIRLTTQAWDTCLKDEKKILHKTWHDHYLPRHNHHATLKYIEDNSANFRFNCTCFIQDLRNYGTDEEAQWRLAGTGNRLFLGYPYFDPTVVAYVLNLPTPTGKLMDRLKRLEQTRAGDTICASRDLAPIYESALQVGWDNREKRAIPHKISEGPDLGEAGAITRKVLVTDQVVLTDKEQRERDSSEDEDDNSEDEDYDDFWGEKDFDMKPTSL